MERTKHREGLEQDSTGSEQSCAARMYEDMTLPMIMIQGWFNDQCKCLELFRQELTDEEQVHVFTIETCLESVKRKYTRLWDSGRFQTIAKQNKGEHKRLNQLNYESFQRWADCVSAAVAEAGSLETLLETIDSVEAAHDRSKHWFYKNAKKVRYLNVADAARILARYGYLEPEKRPLLARGALRGAAILLNGEPPWKTIDRLEREYAGVAKRISLEEKAAVYIKECATLSHFGKWKMEMGQKWFCEVVHKER